MTKDQDIRQAPEGLEVVGGVLWPSDRAEQARRELQEEKDFIHRFCNRSGLAELEERLSNSRKALEKWNCEHPAEKEYLDAIDVWKRGWEPLFSSDTDDAKKAEERMRELEVQFGIKYQDISIMNYPEAELKARGYNDQQISILVILNAGKSLQYSVEANESNVNRAKNLMAR